MTDEELKQIVPIPELEEMSSQTETELIESGFIIKNFRTGKIFKTLEMIFLKAVNELYKLLATVVKGIYVTDAEGFWLDMKALEFGKTRKQATKTEGLVAVSRNESDGKPKLIPKGTIFKTDPDKDGNELRYIATENVVMEYDQLKVYVPVVAEFPGTKYNVSANMIKYSLQHLSGIDNITNESDWLTKEGTDTETDDSFRKRCLAAWDELSTNLTASAYASIVNDVDGVLTVYIDDEHPRGQGTIDIVVTGVAGLPTEALLQAVRDKVEEVKGPYDNVMVFGPEPVYQDVDVTIYIDEIYGDEQTIETEAINQINKLFEVSETNHGNKLYRAKINQVLMGINNVVNVIVNQPVSDIVLDIKKLLVPGTITVTVIKESN
ncbi:baseplate J/gp47 family protein [Caloranaerobacter sp. DY30410]|uniref:baseplate J/gp47 family protein n=1 Tax=Caloranaerobacter sp. DY30410 TaxID=3238305 RepID=UPI003D0349DC